MNTGYAQATWRGSLLVLLALVACSGCVRAYHGYPCGCPTYCYKFPLPQPHQWYPPECLPPCRPWAEGLLDPASEECAVLPERVEFERKMPIENQPVGD